MGKINFPKPAKLIISMISSDVYLFNFFKEALIKSFSKVDLESNIQPFNFTNYYEKEFGKDLIQKLFSFDFLIKPDQLPEIKKITNDLENNLIIKKNIEKDISLNRRKINLDPGYITLNKFILASTKNGPSRIYLDNGIYAEITLRFINKSFVPGEYTYSNYKTLEYINFLNKVRQRYKLQLRKYLDKTYTFKIK